MARLGGGRAASMAEWQALATRDSRLGGGVYGVASTGIHCRVGCPARMPLPQNLRMFDSVEQAEAAGFRACKRCGGGVRTTSNSQG